MTDLTYGLQLRKATVTDRVAKYKIDMHISDRGELPDRHVFLKSIVDDTDPKKDRLHRVCRVGDMVTFPKSREAALKARNPLWRDVSLVKLYDSLSEAKVAAGFLVERVNTLVTEYVDYTENFKSIPGEALEFPQVGAGVLTPLINTFQNKVDERKAQEEVLADKEADCEKTSEKYTAVLLELTKTRSALQALNVSQSALTVARASMLAQQQINTSITGPITNALSAWDSIRSSAAAAVQNAMDPTLEDPTGTLFDVFHTEFTPGMTALTQSIAEIDAQLTEIGVELAAQNTRKSEAESERDTLLTAKEECAADVASAAATLQTLQQQEQDLLDEIQDLCPDFTPEST